MLFALVVSLQRPESLSISPESSLTRSPVFQTNGLAGKPSQFSPQSPAVDNTDGPPANTGTPNSDREKTGEQNGESLVHTKRQSIKEESKTTGATDHEYRENGSEKPCSESRPPGVVKAKLEKRLSKLLTTFATKDALYSGLEMTPSTPAGHDLPSLPSIKSTPDSQPPSLCFGM